MANKDFKELLYRICEIASREMEMDMNVFLGRNIDQHFLEYCDFWETCMFIEAVEKEFNIVLDKIDAIDNIIDLSFFIYNYDFFLHGGNTPTVSYEDRQEIRDKMRPILEDIFGKEEVSQLSIYDPTLIQDSDSEDSLTWEMVPDEWAFCFRVECPLHNECLRWQTSQLVPDDINCLSCIIPSSPIGHECLAYVSMEKVLAARGFTIDYDSIRQEDQPVIRKELEDLLGSYKYKEYQHGFLLTWPSNQKFIKSVFEEYGYQDCIKFNEFVEVFNFGH